MRERDSQRHKVYRAEREAGIFELKKFASFEEAVKFGKRVVASKHWQKHHPRAYVREWKCNHSGGRSHAAMWHGVTLSKKHGLDAATVLHELSHVAMTASADIDIRSEGWHGRAFVRTYTALVHRFLGREAHDKLKASFKLHGVKFVRVGKPAPVRVWAGSLGTVQVAA